MVPGAGRWTPDGDVGFSVAIVIALDVSIGRHAPRRPRGCAPTAGQRAVPDAAARPEDRAIRPLIAIDIAACRGVQHQNG